MENDSHLLMQMILNTPNYIFWKDVQSIYRGCNYNFARLAGFSDPKEIIGKSDEELPWGNYTSHLYKEEDRYVITTGNAITSQEVPIVLDPLQEERFLSINKFPLCTKDGEIMGIFCTFIDITAEKNAAKLTIEKAEAQQRAEYLRAAAGSIAHELRTPLASIGMAAKFVDDYWDILLNSYKLAQQATLPIENISRKRLAQLDGRIESIIQQIHFANAFIDLILGNLKEEGEFDIAAYRAYDMNMVINTCLARYPLGHHETLFINWEAGNTFEFLGDEFLMINVLNNLIKNALYFIKDARKGEIYIWLESGKEINTLYFKDTAKGAPPEVVARLFESFYSKRHGGTGLGLAFCKKIMRSFGGDIQAESVDGEYMQFKLTFPHLSDAFLA